MAYTAPTLVTARAQLASRLNDPGMVHWVAGELDSYLAEALRVWNAWTSHWRDEGTIATVINQAFYDLPTELPTLRSYSVTNWDLVADLQRALMETVAPGGTWSGTDQFTLDQLSQAISRRRDQFLRDTGSVLTRTETVITPPGSGRLTFPENVLQIRRAAWKPTATQLLIPLKRSDEWAGNAFARTWPSSSEPPFAYSTSVTPPLTMQMMPAGGGLEGTLDLVSVNAGAFIDPGVETVLGIPDDWTWVIKYGALADLLQGDGLALDPQRAQYCEQRWAQGVSAAKTSSVVLISRINNSPVPLGSLNDADSFDPLWQLVNRVCQRVLLAGGNLIAAYPPPGPSGYTLTLDVVTNAPIPVVDADVLQVGPDVFDSLLDYAQHVALMKEGPGQTQTAMGLLQRFSGAADIDLGLQQAEQPTRAAIFGQGRQDERGTARELPVVEVP